MTTSIQSNETSTLYRAETHQSVHGLDDGVASLKAGHPHGVRELHLLRRRIRRGQTMPEEAISALTSAVFPVNTVSHRGTVGSHGGFHA